ncbi:MULTISPECIES: error-prone DNA polymerase [Paraburkholderia]|uniref:Error-prone DNA polymerase n=1 Tax=Paraburkholderia nemoris TaxID=2793076 RepID=A0ABM8T1E3_9BURK|nr:MULTISPECIES: error-prone DNA polymerase [Paraburkholderia]MBK5152791.1 error-prone DNA polymerase [Burkholderia sp. R-69608]MBK5184358.1 error-prone DNA polymerase [Burkholderia sp. R-69749]MBK3744679.1 error-prone DNA polymerase [Paraburkholderia aspalathi]MBK3815789.1 error-prone DNA polymerase [Paraburkholderia aspalathi]CAE6820542.1 Error-prone DNA polymerase [Paraburkholderia nemoris]
MDSTFSSLPAYAELFCFSNFTFLHGASHAEELSERAAQLGYSALAVTDECSLAGVVRAHVAAKKAKLPFIVGSYFRLANADGSPAFGLILLARNREGYGNLSELITLARTRAPKGEYRLTPQDLSRPDKENRHLLGMPDCLAILVPDFPAKEDVLAAQVEWLDDTFTGRAWVGLVMHQRAMDDIHRGAVEFVARSQDVPVVALGNVVMHVRSRKPLQDTMTAIRVGRPVHECGYDLAPNAEQHIRSRLRLANLYPDEALAATVDIACRCTFSLDELRYEYPDELVPAGFTSAAYLRQETYIGARRRFPSGIPHKVQEQIEHELDLIADLQYEAYFLTVYDIVRFARSQHILCQGRGSAANSAVCFCLSITEVDPARGSMLFERFISKERGEPPDIDVDFEHQRREEVIQYIYRKYGRDRAAIAAAVSTYRPRGALRETGKALGVDPQIVDLVAKSHHWFDTSQDLLKRFAESGLDPEKPLIQAWAKLASQLLGFPRHLSQHSGGFVISRGKLTRLVPVENAAMADRSVIEWDKDDLEALGLLKIDVLALGMLSAIRRTLDIVSEQRGERFEMQDIPAEDPRTYEMISAADTVGVFQIESRAQMSMLPRMQPRTFYDLVIEVAIVRPGPIQGGAVHPYLQRRQGFEPVTYPSEALKTALGRTLGIPIFQEQVMQVAILAAGFTAGEADQLRRAMAAWKRKGGLEKYYDRIVNGMQERGYDLAFAEGIFEQIKGFGEYGFPESHAASFALLVYASSWLKCHEPEAFLAAMLNSQPMGFYSPSQLVQDAQRHGVKVLPVDVTVSGWDSTLVKLDGIGRPAVRLGLSLLRGMKDGAAERIENARAVRPFGSVKDMARRAQLDRKDLHILADANALALLAGNRREALWQSVAAVPDKDMLAAATVEDETPELGAPTEALDIVADYRSVGLTLGRHPLELLRPQLLANRLMPASTLRTYRDGRLARGCGLVTVRQRPGTAKGVLFVTLEDETGNVNVIIWPSLFEKQRKEALGASLLAVYGTWQCQGEVRHLVAQRLVDMSSLLGSLTTVSRNFC